MTVPTITTPPTAPSRSDAPATFISRADAFIAWFATLVTELTTAIGWFDTTATAVDADAATATAQAAAATTKAAEALASATAAAASSASALSAPGTSATSTSSMAIGTGSKSLTLTQTGKGFGVGQTVVLADNAAPATNQMIGQISAFDSASGAMTVNVTDILGSGTKTSWTVSLGAVSVPAARTISVSGGMLSGGGDLSANRTITLTPAADTDIWAGTSAAKPITPDALFDSFAEVALTDAATIAVDFALGLDFAVTITADRTLGNPTNMKRQSGSIKVTNGNGGGWDLTLSSYWIREGGSSAIAQGANEKSYLIYKVVSATEILYNWSRNPTN